MELAAVKNVCMLAQRIRILLPQHIVQDTEVLKSNESREVVRLMTAALQQHMLLIANLLLSHNSKQLQLRHCT
jgi:hypothetical protein